MKDSKVVSASVPIWVYEGLIKFSKEHKTTKSKLIKSILIDKFKDEDFSEGDESEITFHEDSS